MPYIKQEDRNCLDDIFFQMREQNIRANGDLNYLLFKYCKYCIPKSYNSLKNYIGELRQCAVEIERKILAKYEDLKEKENGKV